MKIYMGTRHTGKLLVWVIGERVIGGARRLEYPAHIRYSETPVTTTDHAVYSLPSVTLLGTGYDGGEFECGYPGRGPAALAISILMDHYQDVGKALAAADEFQRHYIENIPQYLTRWEFTTTELTAMLEAIEERLGFEAKDQEKLDNG